MLAVLKFLMGFPSHHIKIQTFVFCVVVLIIAGPHRLVALLIISHQVPPFLPSSPVHCEKDVREDCRNLVVWRHFSSNVLCELGCFSDCSMCFLVFYYFLDIHSICWFRHFNIKKWGCGLFQTKCPCCSISLLNIFSNPIVVSSKKMLFFVITIIICRRVNLRKVMSSVNNVRY